MRFRYGLVGNLIFFGGSVACAGYFVYLLYRSSNNKIDRNTMVSMMNTE